MSSSSDQADEISREVAKRVFAAEFEDTTFTFRESDDDRAPVYGLLPTGQKANRILVAGTATETNDVGDDEEYWQLRLVGPTGTFFAYAGQYQPDAMATIRALEPPEFVIVVGKPRTYETDEGDINVSIRPEHVKIVDRATRDHWVEETAEKTLNRIEAFDSDVNKYASMAMDEYGGDLGTYRDATIEALSSLEDQDGESADNGAGSASDETAPTDGEQKATATAESGEGLGDFEGSSL
jgi:RPA family protein